MNITFYIISTDDSLYEKIGERTFDVIEGVSVALFTVRALSSCCAALGVIERVNAQVEHILRVWSSVGDPRYARLGPLWGRLRYMRSFHGVIDFLAIAPYYVSWFANVHLSFTTALRVLRMFRLLKFDNYTRAFYIVRGVFYKEKEMLLVASFYTFVALLFCASAMYILEPDTAEFKYCVLVLFVVAGR